MRERFHTGMTIREAFAMAAMMGMIMDKQYDPGRATPQQRANLSLIEADALLEALATMKP